MLYLFVVIITFEGIDGVGKTTQMKFASKLLAKLGVDHITTQEFGGDDTRINFRSLFMHELSDMEELMVVSLARIWHKNHLIQPALNSGKSILIDRYTESTWAYQHGGRGIDAEVIQFLEDKVWQVPKPDLVIYLAGKSNRTKKNDRFELEVESFFDRVTNVYESRKSANWFKVEGSDFTEVRNCIENKLKQMFA